MKSVKVGPDDILVEAWRCFRRDGSGVFNCLTLSWKVRGYLRSGEEVCWFKNKVDVQSCSKFRGTMLSQSMKLWERVAWHRG